jgi:hypothetical protein
VAYGPLVALDDRPRPGKGPTITAAAKSWLVSLACRKAKKLGYPHEVWTTRLLAQHTRENGPAGHECLGNLVQGTVCKILDQNEVKPHKMRYCLERRDPEFEQKMAQELCVYREVVGIISYDEKPGIQAIATTAPDLRACDLRARRPGDADDGCAAQILSHRRSANADRDHILPLARAECKLLSQDFSNLPHQRSLGGHRTSSCLAAKGEWSNDSVADSESVLTTLNRVAGFARNTQLFGA